MEKPSVTHKDKYLEICNSVIIGAGSSQMMWGQAGSAIHTSSYILIRDIKKTFHSHALHLICAEPTFMRAHFVWAHIQ